MNKQLVQQLVKAYNDYRNDEMIHILVETNSRIYNCYDRIGYGNRGLSFIDEDGKAILLEYKDIVGVKVAEIQNVIQCVIEGEKVKDSVAETVHLSHLLITLATTNSLPTRVPYSNNINNYINVITITYTTHNSTTIVTYYSTTYDNNSIYFTTITLVDITISATSSYSNVLILIY